MPHPSLSGGIEASPTENVSSSTCVVIATATAVSISSVEIMIVASVLVVLAQHASLRAHLAPLRMLPHDPRGPYVVLLCCVASRVVQRSASSSLIGPRILGMVSG